MNKLAVVIRDRFSRDLLEKDETEIHFLLQKNDQLKVHVLSNGLNLACNIL